MDAQEAARVSCMHSKSRVGGRRGGHLPLAAHSTYDDGHARNRTDEATSVAPGGGAAWTGQAAAMRNRHRCTSQRGGTLC
jgi:hypothetical protein